MTVELSANDVCDAFRREEGCGGGVAPGLLGRAFRQTFAALASDDPARSGLPFAYEAGVDAAEGKRRLLGHAYAALVGPWLAREQRQLHAASEGVLAYWGAVGAMSGWLYDLFAAVRADGDGPPRWHDAARTLRSGVPLEGELFEPGWAEPVRLAGVADAVAGVRHNAQLYVVEFDLAERRPTPNLASAALCQLLARRAPAGGEPAVLTLVRFAPAAEETSPEGSALAEAEAKLVRLIGRLAGVAAPGGGAPSSSSSSSTAARVPATLRTPAFDPTSGAPARAATAAGPAARPVERTSGPAAAPDAARFAALGEGLQRALREYVPDVQIVGAPSVGPRFVRFELRLGRGGKVDKVKATAPEVGLRLGLAKQPIVMHAQGRLTVDVERADPETLPFGAIRAELAALRRPGGSSCLPVGVDLGGTLHLADLADPSTAHALVAGTTGSGKTEWLRTAIAGLLLTNTPETLRVLLIDPKRVAFSDLRRSPFLWNSASFWDNGGEADVVELLEALAAEMDRRYGLLAEAGVDNLLEYARVARAPLPRLVCFCDEYFALLAQGDAAQERAVKRLVGVLGAKGRAAGVHLVLATQQPSRRVVSGPIDANIPCRVGLMMANAIDSRMIIQAAGAERLTGRGDLLYKSIGDPVRLQSPYLASAERARVFGGA